MALKDLTLSSRGGSNLLQTLRGANTLPNLKGNLARNDEACYAIRDYRFSQVTPQSDATRLSSFSTCLPADQVHAKTIR